MILHTPPPITCVWQRPAIEQIPFGARVRITYYTVVAENVPGMGAEYKSPYWIPEGKAGYPPVPSLPACPAAVTRQLGVLVTGR